MAIVKTASYITLLVIISLVAMVVGCVTIVSPGGGPTVIGSGNLQTLEMDFSDFTDIEVGYTFDVDISRADSYLVQIHVDDNLLDYLDVNKSGNTLHIGLKPNQSYANITSEATINLPDLHRLSLSGASKAYVGDFSFSHSMDFDLSGASHMDISSMETGDTHFELSGASHASGSIEMADGRFNLSGASSVDLEGSGDDVSIEASGASRVELADLPVTDATVNLSGASRATINSSGRLDCDLSGASTLSYIGNPTIGNINTSGGSTIRQK